MREAENMRRREQERYKLERLRLEVQEQKQDNFKRKLDQYHSAESEHSAHKAMKVERKHMTAE
jgi:hypothetical protein